MGKIKQFIESEQGKDVLVVIIVILVGLGSFELGRLSKGNGSSGIKIEYTDQAANAVNSLPLITATSAAKNQNSAGKNYFASSRGSRYYSLGCSAGKTIKQENRVYFATADEAEAAGYILSTSCN